MGKHDIRLGSRDRFDARTHRAFHLAFRLAAGRRRAPCAFRITDHVGSAAEWRGRDPTDQRQNRKPSSSKLDDDLSRLELAAFALYVEAAAPELANGLAESAVRADGKVASRLESFTRRVIERFDRVLETASAPPHAKVLRF